MFPCAAAGAAEIVAATAVNHGTSRQSLSTVTSLALQQHLPANTLCAALAGPRTLEAGQVNSSEANLPCIAQSCNRPPWPWEFYQMTASMAPSFDAARLCRRRGDIDPFKQQAQ